MRPPLRLLAGLFALAPAAVPAAEAPPVVTVKQLSLEAAREIADRALEACRANGWHVSVVVLDRGGAPQVVLRDVYAARETIELAERKANASVMSGIESSTLRRNRADIRPELNEVKSLLVLEGGVPIRAGGALVGAVGVSGAPGGDKDEACAQKAVAVVQERLDFAD